MNKDMLRSFVHYMKALGVEHGGLIRIMELLQKFSDDDKAWAEDYYLGRVM